MMNITLLAAQAALADTIDSRFRGGSDESLGYGDERWMDHACAGIVVCRLFLYFL